MYRFPVTEQDNSEGRVESKDAFFDVSFHICTETLRAIQDRMNEYVEVRLVFRKITSRALDSNASRLSRVASNESQEDFFQASQNRAEISAFSGRPLSLDAPRRAWEKNAIAAPRLSSQRIGSARRRISKPRRMRSRRM